MGFCEILSLAQYSIVPTSIPCTCHMDLFGSIQDECTVSEYDPDL
jgi:hypothetical protein